MASHVHPSNTNFRPNDFIVPRAFLVQETCLDVLFQCLVCTKCQCSPQNVAKCIDGDCLFVTVLCPSGHLMLRWSSRYVKKIERQDGVLGCKQPSDTDQTGETRNIVQGVTEVSNRDGFGRKVSTDEDATVASSSDQETVDQEGEGQEVFGGQIVIKLEKEDNSELPEVFAPSSFDQDPVSAPSEMTAGPQDRAGDMVYQNRGSLPQERSGFNVRSGNWSEVRDVVTTVATSTQRSGEHSHQIRKSRKHLCSFCTKYFSMSYNLRLHELMHRRKNQRRHFFRSSATTGNSFCRRKKLISWMRHHYLCKFKFLSGVSERRQHCHVDKQKAGDTNIHLPGSSNLATINANSAENHSVTKHGFKCFTCRKEFISPSSCRKHQQRHFPFGKKKLPDVLKKRAQRLQWFKKASQDSSSSDLRSIHSQNCQICGTFLTTAFRKWVHKSFHSQPKTFHCQLCPRGFALESTLKEHLNVHIVEKHFACKFCRKRFSSHVVKQQHEKTHQGRKPFNCSFCDCSFEILMDRNEHEKLSHTGQTTIPCKFCCKIFKSAKVHRSHEKKHLVCSGIEMEKGNMESSEYLKVLSNITAPSQGCSTKDSLYETSDVPVAFSVEEPELETFSCKFCGKQALSALRLATHKCIHGHLTPFKCQDCLKSFATRSSLLWHTENAHRVKCRSCDQQFRSTTLCREHERINHSINRSETVTIDLMTTHLEGNRGSGLRDGSDRGPSLKRHEGRTLGREEQSQKTPVISPDVDSSDVSMLPSVGDHTTSMQSSIRTVNEVTGVPGDESSFPSQSGGHEDKSEDGRIGSEMQPSTSTEDSSSCLCRYCGKQLSSATGRRYHERIHTGLKPHKCRFCPKAFSEGSMLKAHERIHTGEKPYSCSFCDKKFFQSSHKKSHERVHTGERPYQCSFCQDRFTTSSCRHKHEERIHSMEKKYKCEYCSEVFSQSRVYSAHRKKHREEFARLAANGQASYQSGDQQRAAAAEEEKESNDSVESVDAEIVGRGENEVNKLVPRNETALQTNGPVRKEYPCRYCSRVLYAEGNRKVHEKKHWSDWSIKCRFCNVRFPNAETYKSHEVTHTGETPYRCRYCDESFDQSLTRENHEFIHTTDMAFACRYCDIKFMSKCGRDEHEQLHSETPYKCQFCDQAFSFSHALDDHMITCGLVKRHSCNSCGMQFATKKCYKEHMATHGHGIYVCTKCGKIFKSATDVKYHERIHSDEKPYKCQFCDKTFKTKLGTKRHEQRHSESRAFQCRYCEKSFKTKPSRQVHEWCHTGEKPYPCSYCDTRFNSISARRTHHLLHTGEVPHKCQYCSRPFRHNSSLNRHLRLHTGEKPYQCKHCGERFRDIKQWKNHEYKHTGERPFMCSYCGKSFRDKMQLVKHEYTHTGEKPLKCMYCEERFAFYTSRKNHMKRFHGEMMAKAHEGDATRQGNVTEENLT